MNKVNPFLPRGMVGPPMFDFIKTLCDADLLYIEDEVFDALESHGITTDRQYLRICRDSLVEFKSIIREYFACVDINQKVELYKKLEEFIA